MKSKASPQLTSPTSGHTWFYVVFTWFYVVKSGVMWLSGVMCLSGFMWLSGLCG